MAIRDWVRQPRHVLAAFLVVVAVSGVGLVWLVLAEDRALERQQRAERLEEADDRAVAVMQRAMADLDSLIRRGSGAVPPAGVTVAFLGANGISTRPHCALLYDPEPPELPEAPTVAFSEAERLLSSKDLLSVRMAQVVARCNAIPHQLLQLLDFRKSSLCGARPNGAFFNPNLEYSSGAGPQYKLADLVLKGREEFLRHPGGSKEPPALRTIFDLHTWMFLRHCLGV